MPKRTGLTMKCPHCEGTGRMSIERASVGDMILASRKAKGMTQEELASRVELSRAQVANLEGGRSDTSLRALMRFAEALGVTTKELVP